jgi:branched-chain amino acid transport system permease protein
MGIAIVFALSYNMLLGQTGMLSFGHAIYFGLGGYCAIHVLNAIKHGLPLPVALLPLVGGLGGLFFGLLFGLLSTRRAGTSFAMITLGLVELVSGVALLFDGFFGGEEGISGNRTAGPHLLGLSLGPQIQVFYLVAAWALLSGALMYGFTRTPLGRLCYAVRDNPERVQFLCYDTARIRLIVFALSGLFAGVAGGLFAINYEQLAISSLGAERSSVVLLMAYIGGTKSFFGPILGAILVTFLQVSLSDYTNAWLMYLGLFFILMVMYAPNGLAGLILLHVPALQARLLHRLLPAYGLASIPTLLLAGGAIILIEVSYRLAIRPDLGKVVRVFGLDFDAAQSWPWGLMAVCILAGTAGLKLAIPVVAARWDEIAQTLKAHRA